jgi:hypothetical protein
MKPLLRIVMTFALFSPGLQAQWASEVKEFDELKKKHLVSARTATQLIEDRYRVTLRRLEQEKAEKGDYLGAATVKGRLEQMERIEPEALLTQDPPLTSSVVGARSLRLNAGSLSGAPRVENSTADVLFTRDEQAIEWLLNGLSAGRYRLELIYALSDERDRFFRTTETRESAPSSATSPTAAVAALEITVSDGLGLSQRLQRQNLSLEPTGSQQQMIRRQATLFEVGPRTPTLRLRYTTVGKKEGYTFSLRAVELIPITPDQPIKERIENPTAELTNLTAELRAQQQTLWALRESLASEYDPPLSLALDYYHQQNQENEATQLQRWQSLWLDLASEPAYFDTEQK